MSTPRILGEIKSAAWDDFQDLSGAACRRIEKLVQEAYDRGQLDRDAEVIRQAEEVKRDETAFFS